MEPSNEYCPTKCAPAVSKNTQSTVRVPDLPNPTSIRLLDIIDSQDGKIRCSMRVVDLEDENLDYAAISYTWGNPITVYEEPMPDLTGLTFSEHAEQLPFTYRTSRMGPNHEVLYMVDSAKLHYYSRHTHVPHEKLRWQERTPREIELLFLEALLELRERLLEAPCGNEMRRVICLPIWVDALCINQADLAERAAQVQLMGRIYKSAHMVFAWVGKDHQLSVLAESTIGMILDFDATRLHAEDSSYPEQEEVTLSSIPGVTVVHWFALFALFQRLWFRRAWVVQEAVFAKISMDIILAVIAFLEDTGLDHELCQLGQNFLTNRPVSDEAQHWEKLTSFSSQEPNIKAELQVEPRDAASFILGYHHIRARLGMCNAGMPMLYLQDDKVVNSSANKARWIVHIPDTIHLRDHTVENVFNEELGMQGIRFHRRPLRLLSILSNFRDLEATDPRDKILAFLNLAEDDLGLAPDYYANARDVFTEAAKAMIRKRLGLARLPVLIQGLPSWVPDFSARLGQTPFDQGGDDDRFRAGVDEHMMEDINVCINQDDTLTVNAIKVENVIASTDLDQDPVIQILKLALKSPADYPINPMTWWVDNGNRILRFRAVTRVEALWCTLIADNLTEADYDYGSLDSRDALGSGFSNWILTDILEAIDLFVERIELESNDLAQVLSSNSFCTRMALWSAMYDGRRLSNELEVPCFTEIVADLKAKIEQETEAEARQIGGAFRRPPISESQQQEDPIRGKYKRPSMQRLTPLERRKVRNFEKHMRKATEGRKLFMTESGLFGLGPKSLGQNSNSKDEVWILMGARVSFILRKVEGGRYMIVKEAYVHGIMYGEGNGYYAEWDEYGRWVERISLA
ncbi:heterokaryon incompatibility protein-domain-containing protein [Leptodontidium sp. MPI-SDFR-AT-0119]|nr:heterokaryon incompatibility protein-domain-containing protein [Leptodontidium sp. MPI-SDFR-AT-0119]